MLFSLIYRRYVRLGETPKSTNEFTDYKVVRMEVHPKAKWADTKTNLAVLFLEKDVEFTSKIKIILKQIKVKNI